MTVARHPSIVPGTKDKWSLSTIDLSAKPGTWQASLIEVEIKPQPAPLEDGEPLGLWDRGVRRE